MPPSSKSSPHQSLPFCKFGFFLPLGEQLGSFDAASPYGRWIAGSVPTTTTHGRCGARSNAGFQVGQPRVETVQRQRHPKTGVLPKTKNSRKTPRPVPPHNTTHTHTPQTRLHGRHRFQNAPSRLHAARAATTVDRSLHSFFGEANGGRHIKEGRRSAPTLFREVSNVAASFDRLQIGFNLSSFLFTRCENPFWLAFDVGP